VVAENLEESLKFVLKFTFQAILHFMMASVIITNVLVLIACH
jgi:hypothetical protein